MRYEPTADPDSLDRLAGDVDRSAAELEEIVSGVRRHSDGLRWEGEAAERFRRGVADDHAEALRACGELRNAAQELRRAAREIRDRRRAQAEAQARAQRR